MKKTLAVIGILVCSAGMVWADEFTSPDMANSVQQQVEVQSQLDRTNFQNAQKYEKFNRSLNYNGNQDKIKFDKSVNDKKYKNFEKKKGDYKNNRPRITDKKYDKSFGKNIHPSDRFVGHKPIPKYEYSHHRAHNVNIHNMHKPNKYYRAKHSQHRNVYRRG